MSSSRLIAGRCAQTSSFEPLEARNLFTVFIVTNIADSAATAGSLRWAMQSANATAGTDQIVFDIPGAGSHTIQPLSPLPLINETVSIDGTTQSGFTGAPLIEINGALAGAAANGLRIGASNCVVRGLAVNGFGGNGIVIGGVANPVQQNAILGNYIGVDVDGTTGVGNGMSGVLIAPGASRNTIGGAKAEEVNVISANNLNGITLRGGGSPFNSNLNVIRRNHIGVDAAGTNALGNSMAGIAAGLFTGATIDGGNIISANGDVGVRIDAALSDQFRILGNIIGSDVSGTLNLGNGSHGVHVVRSADTRIGGLGTGERNLISANEGDGVRIEGFTFSIGVVGNFIGTDGGGGSSLGNEGWGIADLGDSGQRVDDNVISANRLGGLRAAGGGGFDSVQGNRIGTTADGLAALGNAGPGILAEWRTGLQIGSSIDPDRGNVIAGNLGDGVRARLGVTSLFHNAIGVNAAGAALGNGRNGVLFEAGTRGGQVGDAGAPNTIAFNRDDGVVVLRGADEVLIRGNSIHSNGQLGIDLNNDGVTTNDFWDVDDGANGSQNFPTITRATINPLTLTMNVGGSLISAPFRRYRIDVYASAAADPSGFGEGQRYVGSGLVTTNVLGVASFDFSFVVAGLPGTQITATATFMRPIGGVLSSIATSEFGRAFAATTIPIGDPLPFSIRTEAALGQAGADEDLEELISTR